MQHKCERKVVERRLEMAWRHSGDPQCFYLRDFTWVISCIGSIFNMGYFMHWFHLYYRLSHTSIPSLTWVISCIGSILGICYIFNMGYLMRWFHLFFLKHFFIWALVFPNWCVNSLSHFMFHVSPTSWYFSLKYS